MCNRHDHEGIQIPKGVKYFLIGIYKMVANSNNRNNTHNNKNNFRKLAKHYHAFNGVDAFGT